jgi:hypothetical protein
MHNLMGHLHLHSDSKPFKCLYCPSKFTLKGNLTRHMKVKHGVMERGLHSQGTTSSVVGSPACHTQGTAHGRAACFYGGTSQGGVGLFLPIEGGVF